MANKRYTWWWDLLHLPSRVKALWRHSLQLRSIVASVALTGVAIAVVGIYMGLSIGNDLFNSRLNQVLAEAQRAQQSAQRIFDSAETSNQASAQSVMNAARVAIRDASSSNLIAVYRAPGQEYSANAVQSFASVELTQGVISEDLRSAVQAQSGSQYWQSVTLDINNQQVAGVVVGSLLQMPGQGTYELYMGFDFQQANETLRFIQQVMWVSGVGLLILAGGVAWVVTRRVVSPIQKAADTSEQLALGNYDVRMPVTGEDVLSSMARGFNHMAESIQLQVSELAELSMVQQRFVSDVSHELRTPLTTIRLAGDVLYNQRDDFDETTKRTAELLHDQIIRFEGLLADLLEISRFDAKSVQLELESTNIATLVSDLVESMSDIAARHHSELRFTAPGGHVDAQVDPRRIRRILTNLIGNAIEHGQGHPIDISVDSNKTAVAIAVRDYGVGIAEDQVENVFNRFWRADPSRQRTLGGTGLGLAIALEDAKVHGGTLDVWAHLNEGAMFRLTLPRDARIAITASPIDMPAGFSSSPTESAPAKKTVSRKARSKKTDAREATPKNTDSREVIPKKTGSRSVSSQTSAPPDNSGRTP